MRAHGVAIFQRDYRGDVPVAFAAGTDPAAIERAWAEACAAIGAAGPEELRNAGCTCRLVCLDPLGEEHLDRPRLIDDCLELVEVRFTADECTSECGDQKITEAVPELRLLTGHVEVPAVNDVDVLPEFETVYTMRLDDGRELELGLLFVLDQRTDATAIYRVSEHDSATAHGRSAGRQMAASARSRERFQPSQRRLG